MTTNVIQDVVVRGLSYPAGPLSADRWGVDEQALLLTLRSSGGNVGQATLRCNLGASYRTTQEWVVRIIAPKVLGREVTRDSISRLWEELSRIHLRQYIPIGPLSLVDVAFWDLLGHVEGQPIRTIINPAAPSGLAAYSSIPRYKEVQPGVADALRTLALGYSAVKVHTCGDVTTDIELLSAIADAVNEHGRIMYDGSQSLTVPEALEVASVLGDIGAVWFEEPFDPFNRQAHLTLQSATSVPVVGFETAPGGPGAALWAIEHGGMDTILMDCNWKGGVTGALATATALEDIGVRPVMHHGASSSMNVANMHVVASLPGVEWVELLTPIEEYSHGHCIPQPARDGTLRLNDAPGLGSYPDSDWVDQHTIVDSLEEIPGRG